MLPANIYSFLGRRSLPWWLHKKLASNQRNITDLQVSLSMYLFDNSINILPELYQRETDLKRLDMYIVSGSPLNGQLLDYVEAIGSNLQSLSLSANINTDVSKLLRNHEWPPYQPKLPLKELRLTGLTLMHMYNSLSTIIDFSKLQKLDLVECAGAFGLLADITNAMPNQQFDLTHLALNEFVSRMSIIKTDDERNIHLVNFLKACPNLRSLHFGHYDLEALPPGLRQYLQSRGKELTSLSLYSKTEIIDAGEFDLVCRSCPNLEQFAAGIDEEFIMADGLWYHNLRDFVVSLTNPSSHYSTY